MRENVPAFFLVPCLFASTAKQCSRYVDLESFPYMHLFYTILSFREAIIVVNAALTLHCSANSCSTTNVTPLFSCGFWFCFCGFVFVECGTVIT